MFTFICTDREWLLTICGASCTESALEGLYFYPFFFVLVCELAEPSWNNTLSFSFYMDHNRSPNADSYYCFSFLSDNMFRFVCQTICSQCNKMSQLGWVTSMRSQSLLEWYEMKFLSLSIYGDFAFSWSISRCLSLWYWHLFYFCMLGLLFLLIDYNSNRGCRLMLLSEFVALEFSNFVC